MSQSTPRYDVDPFEEDFFAEDDEGQGHRTIGKWGTFIFHGLKLAFVAYSGAHNVNAALTAAGGSAWAALSQIVGVLVLECTIGALYMAGIGGYITGALQTVAAMLFWVIGLFLASMGIVADSRLNAGQALSPMLDWYLTTGLYLAPVIMIIGVALVVFADPVLFQTILNAKDRTSLRRERVKARVLAEKSEHQAQKIVQNIRLGTQKQLAKYAQQYTKAPEVQEALKQRAIAEMAELMRQTGIAIPLLPTQPEPDQPSIQPVPEPAHPGENSHPLPHNRR